MPNLVANILVTLAVVAAGASLALQQVLNTRLRAELGSPWWAGNVSYAAGTLVMLVAVVISGAPRLSGATLAQVSWPAWTGGLFGAIFVGTAILAVPRLGAAGVLALVVVGQMFAALVFDRIGLMGLSPHPLDAARLTGALFLVFGVVLVRS